MQLRRRSREHAEVSTESLNDIMFFLLLFFLIVSTLVNPNVIKLLLPNSKQSRPVNKQQVTLSSHQRPPVLHQQRRRCARGRSSRRHHWSVARTWTSPRSCLRLDQALTVQDLVDVLQIGNRDQGEDDPGHQQERQSHERYAAPSENVTQRRRRMALTSCSPCTPR